MTNTICEDEIFTNYLQRTETALQLLKAYNADYDDDEWMEDPEYSQDAIFEFPLSISLQKWIRIDLSTGGPADWLEVRLDDNFEPERVVYHYADWFDHAEMEVDEGTDLWNLTEFYVTAYGDLL